MFQGKAPDFFPRVAVGMARGTLESKHMDNTQEIAGDYGTAIAGNSATDGQAKPAKAAKPATAKLLGQVIVIAALEKALLDARSNAKRLKDVAASLDLGKAAKEMDGSDIRVVNLAVLTQLDKLGRLGADKDKAAALKRQIKGLNAIADGLELLGFIDRRRSI